jgi:nucleoid-associated protein YgaU
LRSLWNLIARRLGVTLAAAALIVAALASAPAGAGREGDDAAPDRPETRRSRIGVLDWLGYSRQSYRTLMDMLAERSARLQRTPKAPPGIVAPPDADDRAGPPLPRRSPPPGPPPGPPPDADEGPEEPWPQPRRPRHGGEAASGPNRTRPVQANVWREPRGRQWDEQWDGPWDAHGGARCRKAGVEVEGAGWYVVQAGDTLWSIAERHYGDGEAYRRILRANWQRIADADNLQPCQRLYIPRWGKPRPPDEDDWRDRRRPCPGDRPGPGERTWWPPSCHGSRGGDS